MSVASRETQAGPGPASVTEAPPVQTISAVICTRNRGRRLCLALESLLRQTDIEPDSAEVVVVDNHSTDDTREVAESFRSRMPFRYQIVEEPEVGLSRARNRGLKVASGDVVAFLDDDAVASERWLAAHLAAYSFAERVGGVMGRILPEWEAERPDWLDPALEPFLTIVDHGETPFLLDRPGLTPVGANMSFRRAALEEAGGFDPDFGFGGTLGIPHEETEISHRLTRDGWVLVYWPDAAVRHGVTADRLTWQWFRRRILAQGRGDFFLDARLYGPFRAIKRLGLGSWLRGAFLAVVALADLAVGKRARAARRFSVVLYRTGYLAGLLGKIFPNYRVAEKCRS